MCVRPQFEPTDWLSQAGPPAALTLLRMIDPDAAGLGCSDYAIISAGLLRRTSYRVSCGVEVASTNVTGPRHVVSKPSTHINAHLATFGTLRIACVSVEPIVVSHYAVIVIATIACNLYKGKPFITRWT